MEALSPTMEEGRLVEWKKQPGDSIVVGDVLAEVETDKAVMELVARVGGVLLGHLVPAGTIVPTAEGVAWIGAAGDVMPGAVARAVTSDAPLAAGAGATNAVIAASAAPTSGVVATDLVGAGSAPPAAIVASTPATAGALPMTAASSALKASPLARKMATEQGLDLRAIAGTGPDGRIIQRDIEAALAGGTAPRLSASTPAPAPAAPARRITTDGPGYEDVPLSQIRKTIAARLVQSIGPIPTFYLTADVDMERVAELRALLPPEPKVTSNDIILKSVANALAQHPECNAWWQGEHGTIRRWHEVHLAVAVAIEEGLITPVIRHADRLSLREIATASRDLVARAKARKLSPAEYTGSTFSVSNLGMLGIDEFTAIINPPEAGILAIGRIEPKPVVYDGTVQVRRRLRITLSCDHRVIDGAVGARFLQTLVRMLENPLALVW